MGEHIKQMRNIVQVFNQPVHVRRKGDTGYMQTMYHHLTAQPSEYSLVATFALVDIKQNLLPVALCFVVDSGIQTAHQATIN